MTLKYYSYSYLCYFRSTNIFGYSFGKYMASEYIWIFVRYTILPPNIFGYSFVHFMIFDHHCNHHTQSFGLCPKLHLTLGHQGRLCRDDLLYGGSYLHVLRDEVNGHGVLGAPRDYHVRVLLGG